MWFNGDSVDIMAAEKGREKARDLMAKRYDTIEDHVLIMRYYLSRIYNMPIFHKYFDSLTLEQLAFEVEMHRLASTPQEDLSTEIIKANKEEAAALFDDWADEDFKDSKVPPLSKEEEELFNDFMQDGKFKGEK